jgi:hypothetical protein
LFEAASFLRVVVFAVIYAGIEYRYVNRYERDYTRTAEGFVEKPALFVFAPYHVYFLVPLFALVSFDWPFTTWVANGLVLAVLEDEAYFAWRGRRVAKGEWTTTIMGSFGVAGFEVPAWWPVDILVAAVLYLLPL